MTKPKTGICKPINKAYNANGKEAAIVNVKANNTDKGGNYYVYDLYDGDDKLISLNRYVYKDSGEQPFETLNAYDELILNPPIIESEPKMEVTSRGK